MKVNLAARIDLRPMDSPAFTYEKDLVLSHIPREGDRLMFINRVDGSKTANKAVWVIVRQVWQSVMFTPEFIDQEVDEGNSVGEHSWMSAMFTPSDILTNEQLDAVQLILEETGWVRRATKPPQVRKIEALIKGQSIEAYW